MENWLNENEEKSEQREASMITPGIWSVLAASETRWEKRNAAISSSPIDGPPCVDKVRYNSPSCLLFLQEKWEKKKKIRRTPVSSHTGPSSLSRGRRLSLFEMGDNGAENAPKWGYFESHSDSLGHCLSWLGL
jgi:hypothetical protein